ncbi:B3 domain-containing protein Os01g0723500-like [Rosa rugosa]|uniref:B3 domain-containing protein Os01g0723500-like n=1 Tax=Rosa rugosa TaxID=74645 RepID=UPI002B41064B|nr:B3 domain-containing protein Os01g0723500-like [Rosa rugosa]
MARTTRPVRRRKPSFFKVLIGDFSNHLQIPPAFYKHFDGKGPQQTHLRTLAKTWLVNVEKIDGKFFFRKGWKKFVHGNGLKLGEFLVFRYFGNSKFFVDIYGRNTCKKDFVKAVEKSEKEGHGNEDNQGLKGVAEGTRTGQATNSIHIKDEVIDTESERSLHPLTRNTGKDVALERANAFKIEDEEKQGNDDEDEDDDDSIRIPNDLPPCTKTMEKSPLGPQLVKRRQSSSSTNIGGKDVALQKANAFKSADPSFVVPMHISYVHAGYMNVPSAFAKGYLTKRPSEVTLQVNGETWSVNLQYERNMKRLTTGWADFVRANKLEVGNACVFVLSNDDKFIFDVIVYRAK